MHTRLTDTRLTDRGGVQGRRRRSARRYRRPRIGARLCRCSRSANGFERVHGKYMNLINLLSTNPNRVLGPLASWRDTYGTTYGSPQAAGNAAVVEECSVESRMLAIRQRLAAPTRQRLVPRGHHGYSMQPGDDDGVLRMTVAWCRTCRASDTYGTHRRYGHAVE